MIRNYIYPETELLLRSSLKITNRLSSKVLLRRHSEASGQMNNRYYNTELAATMREIAQCASVASICALIAPRRAARVTTPTGLIHYSQVVNHMHH